MLLPLVAPAVVLPSPQSMVSVPCTPLRVAVTVPPGATSDGLALTVGAAYTVTAWLASNGGMWAASVTLTV
ncbi:MAG: hypothetical protein P8Y05_00240 [Deinococcales bacterium]